MMKSEERKGNFKKENYWYKRVFSLLFFGLLKVNLVNAKFRIFSSQNDDERKFRVVCFLSSLRVSLVFLSRRVICGVLVSLQRQKFYFS